MVALYASAREYIYATLTDAPDDADIEITADWQTWHPTERVGGDIRFLAQGPDAETITGVDVLTLDHGRTLLHARLVDNPEVLIRDAGYIDIKREE